MTEEEAINFLDKGRRFPTEKEAIAFLDEKPKKPSITESIGGALRTMGTIAGGLALLPGAGIRAGMELLPQISTEPGKPLFKPGSLKEAEARLEEIGGVPGEIFLKTPEQVKTTEETAAILAKPFEMAGKGWGLIGKELNKAVAKHYGVDPEDSALEPFLATIGEASAVFGMGSRLFRQKFETFKKGLSAKVTEARLRAGEAKYGKPAIVPEEVTLVKPKPKIAPLSPESKFVKEEFAERFLEGKEELHPEKGKKVPTIKARIEKGKAKVETKEIRESEKLPIILTEKEKAELIRISKKFEKKPEEVKIREKLEEFTVDDYTRLNALPLDKLGKQYTKYIGEPVWDNLVMKKIPQLFDKIPGGKVVNRALLRDYRGNLPNTPGYLKSFDDMRTYQQVGREYAIDVGKRLQAVSEADQLKMGEYIRGEIKDLPLELKGLGDEAKRTLYDLGKQAVDTGLLSEETFFKNAGKYMPRLYTKWEYKSLLERYGLKKPIRLDLSRFKRRKDIPKEIREEMGEILTPGYPVAKGIMQLTHDIEMARFFNGIATNKQWAWTKEIQPDILVDVRSEWKRFKKETKGDLKDAVSMLQDEWPNLNISLAKSKKGRKYLKIESIEPIPEGFKQLPSNKKLGALSESYVHPEIFKDIQEAIRIIETPERIWRKALGAWKFGKVIISPKTHFRNTFFSNPLLAHLGGLPLYEQPWYLGRAAREMSRQGNYYLAARKQGLLKMTWTNQELRELFDVVESQMGGIKASSIPEKLGIIGEVWSKTKAIGRKAAKLYEAEEQWYKMAKFIHNVERKGMSYKDAAADAEKWLFNYGKLTRFQEKYRSMPYGAPFATFTFKALPRIAESMIKTPWRWALPSYIIYKLEQAAAKHFEDTTKVLGNKVREAKRKLLPEWMKGSFFGLPNFIRTNVIDQYGREHYLNATYSSPWGDIGESGGFGPIPGSLVPFTQPFVKETISQIWNYDPYWKEEIVKKTDIAGKGRLTIPRAKTEVKLRVGHAARATLPTLYTDILKVAPILRKKPIPDYRGRLRKRSVVAADVFAGIKLHPVDYIEAAKREIDKLHPQKGYLAGEILSQIKTLYVKREAVAKAGGDETIYDKEIKEKIDQLKGMGKEVESIAGYLEIIKKARLSKPKIIRHPE